MTEEQIDQAIASEPMALKRYSPCFGAYLDSVNQMPFKNPCHHTLRCVCGATYPLAQAPNYQCDNCSRPFTPTNCTIESK